MHVILVRITLDMEYNHSVILCHQMLISLYWENLVKKNGNYLLMICDFAILQSKYVASIDTLICFVPWECIIQNSNSRFEFRLNTNFDIAAISIP